jgi:hypothetical protein
MLGILGTIVRDLLLLAMDLVRNAMNVFMATTHTLFIRGHLLFTFLNGGHAFMTSHDLNGSSGSGGSGGSGSGRHFLETFKGRGSPVR